MHKNTVEKAVRLRKQQSKYSEKLLDYFYHTKHAGILVTNNLTIFTAEVGTLEQGAIIQLYLNIQEKIIQATFKAYGPPPIIAGAEYICQWLIGKTIKEAKLFKLEDLFMGLELKKLNIDTAVLLRSVLEKTLQTFHFI